jgi:hypothetical protein
VIGFTPRPPIALGKELPLSTLNGRLGGFRNGFRRGGENISNMDLEVVFINCAGSVSAAYSIALSSFLDAASFSSPRGGVQYSVCLHSRIVCFVWEAVNFSDTI